MIDRLVRAGVRQAYLQLVEDSTEAALPGEIAVDEEGMRPLVSALSGAGIRVWALDGFAPYALRPYHAGVLRTVERVIAYNERVVPEDRFVGVRYDIEPYLLPGFHGPRRDSISVAFLDLLVQISERAEGAGLHLGADIPFWYDARSKFSYRGAQKPLSHHIIDIVDEVAVMAYRTSAFGADGVIRHSASELAYASTVGKDVLVAIETHPLPDEELIELEGEPKDGLPGTTDSGAMVVMTSRGDSATVRLVDPDTDGHSVLRSMRENMQSGAVDAACWWRVRSRIPVPANKLSFASLGADRLQTTIELALPELVAHRSFAGLAIHHSESSVELLDRAERVDDRRQ